MVTRKKINRKFALISVYEKKNLKYLCTNLEKFSYNFISSGSTGKKIRSIGFKCIDVSKLTKFKEMFGGRVKTLNPLIYSSILYERENPLHSKQFQLLKFPKIDLVVHLILDFVMYRYFLNRQVQIYHFSCLQVLNKNQSIFYVHQLVCFLSYLKKFVMIIYHRYCFVLI